MALTELYVDTGTTVSTTEYDLPSDSTSLGAVTTDGAVQIWLDLNALTNTPDEFEFKIYEKISSGGTQRLVFYKLFSGVQAEPIWVSPTLIFMHGWTCTLKRVGGADKSIAWSIRSAS